MNPPRGAKKFLIGRDLHGGLSLPEGASFFRGRPVLRVDTLLAKIVLIGIALHATSEVKINLQFAVAIRDLP